MGKDEHPNESKIHEWILPYLGSKSVYFRLFPLDFCSFVPLISFVFISFYHTHPISRFPLTSSYIHSLTLSLSPVILGRQKRIRNIWEHTLIIGISKCFFFVVCSLMWSFRNAFTSLRLILLTGTCISWVRVQCARCASIKSGTTLPASLINKYGIFMCVLFRFFSFEFVFVWF